MEDKITNTINEEAKEIEVIDFDEKVYDDDARLSTGTAMVFGGLITAAAIALVTKLKKAHAARKAKKEQAKAEAEVESNNEVIDVDYEEVAGSDE